MRRKNGGGSHFEDSLRLLFLLYIKVKFDSVLKRCRGRKSGEADTFFAAAIFLSMCAHSFFSSSLNINLSLKKLNKFFRVFKN